MALIYIYLLQFIFKLGLIKYTDFGNKQQIVGFIIIKKIRREFDYLIIFKIFVNIKN